MTGAGRPEHDPEKWVPVLPRDRREAFARRLCSNKNTDRDGDSKKSHLAPLWRAAALLLLFTLTAQPAKAQFAGFGGGGGGDMMTQMAPMIEIMKAKMGKRRFGQMMQTMGPMMSRMTQNGGGGFGGTPGGFDGGSGFATQAYGMSAGGDFMIGGGGEMMSMIPQLIQMAHFGGGRAYGHQRHRRR
jgi:hypothetical protein